ncbi:MAG: DUF262 domain-containing protein [Henriciella sp.]
MIFETAEMGKSNVWSLFKTRNRFKMDPDYQRPGGVWSKEKKQLLIDTIINDFDVPKLYLHKFSSPLIEGENAFDYAVIDGKQRLQAIWDFIDGKFVMSQESKYMHDEEIKIAGLSYKDLSHNHPDLKASFDAFNLQVVTVETDDTEIIEDLFLRLNEAVPLNAAEKRNAMGGPLVGVIREISKHKFFESKLPFKNGRYRHYDLAAKMLLLAHRGVIVDLKKGYLDDFVKKAEERLTPDDISRMTDKTGQILNSMVGIFEDSDKLLTSVGMITLYFAMCLHVRSLDAVKIPSRGDLMEFENQRAANREKAEEELAMADYAQLEFDRFAQSPNDAIALRYRLAVIDRDIFNGALEMTQHLSEE